MNHANKVIGLIFCFIILTDTCKCRQRFGNGTAKGNLLPLQ